jgi:hypothetical protein
MCSTLRGLPQFRHGSSSLDHDAAHASLTTSRGRPLFPWLGELACAFLATPILCPRNEHYFLAGTANHAPSDGTARSCDGPVEGPCGGALWRGPVEGPCGGAL